MSHREPGVPKSITIISTLLAVSLACGLWFYILKFGGANRLREVDTAVALTHGGNPIAGHRAIVSFGCGACHVIPGVPAAHGKIGPSLVGFKDRAMIAGAMANSADNLIRWLQDPRGVDH